MSITFEMYNIQAIKAEASNGSFASWVDLTFELRDQRQFTITAFFDDRTTAQRYADAINGAGKTAVASDIYEALKEAIEFQNEDTVCLLGEHPDDGIGVECPDHRCRGNGCMVARVNRWRVAIAKAEQQP